MTIAENLHTIQKLLREHFPHTTLVAVSKTQDVNAVQTAINQGQRVFGENRVQEAAQKFPLLKQAHPDIELHLIGALQTNKAKDAVRLFDVIQTLDRKSLAETFAKLAQQGFSLPQLYIQVNTGDEPQKAGVAFQDADVFIVYCRDELKLPVVGLMCIPPVDTPPAPYFSLLQTLAKKHGLSFLSMGMSGDWQEALQCGATHVRLGTAIFGGRMAST